MRGRPFHLRWLLQAAAVGLVGALLVLLGWRVVSNGRSNGLGAAVGKGEAPPAPDFDLPRLDTPGELRLSSLRGKVVLLDFWASWCVPCSEEAPLLAEAWRRWHGRGVVFVGVDSQDFRSDARRFLRRHGIAYPNVHDGTGGAAGSYGVSGFPETWFVSRDGRLVVRHVDGPLGSGELDHDLTLALRA